MFINQNMDGLLDTIATVGSKLLETGGVIYTQYSQQQQQRAALKQQQAYDALMQRQMQPAPGMPGTPKIPGSSTLGIPNEYLMIGLIGLGGFLVYKNIIKHK